MFQMTVQRPEGMELWDRQWDINSKHTYIEWPEGDHNNEGNVNGLYLMTYTHFYCHVNVTGMIAAFAVRNVGIVSLFT